MSGGTQTAPTPFQPPNQAGSAAAYQSGATQLANLGSTIQSTAVPGYQNAVNAAQNNPYYPGAQSAANATGASGTQFGNQTLGAGSQLQTLSGSLAPYATSIAQTAFDPQGQLYAQQQQQNLQQSAAINAMNGVAGSPYGAGLEALSNQNFNIGWQNNQQQRQLAGVGAEQSLANTQASLATAGTDIGAQGLQILTQSGLLPSNVYNANQANIINSLNALVQGDSAAGQPTQQSVADQGGYLNIGQTAAQGAISAAQANNQASAAFSAGLGNLFGDALGLFSFAGL